MTGRWLGIPIASLASMFPAVLGAMLFARVVAKDDSRLYAASMALGIVCGVVLMALTRGREWDVVAAAVVVAVVAVVIGMLFDAKWNSVEGTTRQLMEQHEGLDYFQARMQATTMLGGMTFNDLVRGRLHVGNLWIPAFAILGAGLTVRSRLFGRLLRITDAPECVAEGGGSSDISSGTENDTP